jgi:hypothetical protein
MTAAEALVAAQAANVRVELKGSDLMLRAPGPPPAAVLEALKRYKPGIVALLRRARSDWTAADWEAFFNERAGIAEYDGGLRGGQAEQIAFEHCVLEWLIRHPVRSNPGACVRCGVLKRRPESCCPSAPRRVDMRGFISIVGQRGTRKEGRKRSLPWRRWESQCLAISNH